MVWWPQAARVYESRSREKFSHLPGRHSGGGIALESVISAFSASTPPPHFKATVASGSCANVNFETQSLLCLARTDVTLIVTVFRTELACGEDRLTRMGGEPLPQLSGVHSLSPGT